MLFNKSVSFQINKKKMPRKKETNNHELYTIYLDKCKHWQKFMHQNWLLPIHFGFMYLNSILFCPKEHFFSYAVKKKNLNTHFDKKNATNIILNTCFYTYTWICMCFFFAIFLLLSPLFFSFYLFYSLEVKKSIWFMPLFSSPVVEIAY